MQLFSFSQINLGRQKLIRLKRKKVAKSNKTKTLLMTPLIKINLQSILNLIYLNRTGHDNPSPISFPLFICCLICVVNLH